MTGRPGVLKEDELWFRCPHCGDSKRHINKAHFSVNVKSGLFSCLRCGIAGKLSTREFMEMLSMIGSASIEEEQSDTLPVLQPGAGSPRPSKLDRGHLDLLSKGEITHFDGFEMKDPRTEDVIGIHLRHPTFSRNIGEKGYGWVGDSFPESTPSEPLRLVEGPYDVLEERDLCTFGLLRRQLLYTLQWSYLILCPDGDVWEEHSLLYPLLGILYESLHGHRVATVIGVEIIPDRKDPDEVPPEMRTLVSREEFPRLFKTLSYGRKM